MTTREVEIEYFGSKTTLLIPDTDLDEKVAGEVLSGRSYPLVPDLDFSPKVIWDVGANVGLASVYFALNYPRAKVYAFEPNGFCAALARRNTKDLDVELREVGLGRSGGRTILHQFKESPLLSSITSLATGTHIGGILVEMVHAKTMLQDLKCGQIDILKIDTEGSELHILRALAGVLPSIHTIYVEYHCDWNRRVIDGMLPNHQLRFANVQNRSVGELCYTLA